jgi:hypothetical protein
MPKVACDIENPVILPISYPCARTKLCSCGCKAEITLGCENYIIIDDWIFAEDSCVTDFFINECGGQRVYA